MISGAHVADALRRSEGGSNPLAQQLHVAAADEAGIPVRFLSFVPAAGSIFRRDPPGVFGDASDQGYFISAVCRLRPEGPGAQPCLLYPDSPDAAAVQYDGSAGGGKAVCVGFPLECVSSAKARARYMKSVLRFFAAAPGH